MKPYAFLVAGEGKGTRVFFRTSHGKVIPTENLPTLRFFSYESGANI